MRVLAIDPGQTTGYAIGELGKTFVVLKTGTVASWSGLDSLIDKEKPVLVLYEEFRLFWGKRTALVGNDMLTSQVVGVIRYVCQLRKITVLGRQPSVRNLPIIPRDDWMKSFLKSLRTDHERDAVRHLYAYWRTSCK